MVPAMLKEIESAPASAFASSIAARSVQTAPAVAQAPSPGLLSAASPGSFTVNEAAKVAEAKKHEARVSATRWRTEWLLFFGGSAGGDRTAILCRGSHTVR